MTLILWNSHLNDMNMSSLKDFNVIFSTFNIDDIYVTNFHYLFCWLILYQMHINAILDKWTIICVYFCQVFFWPQYFYVIFMILSSYPPYLKVWISESLKVWMSSHSRINELLINPISCQKLKHFFDVL